MIWPVEVFLPDWTGFNLNIKCLKNRSIKVFIKVLLKYQQLTFLWITSILPCQHRIIIPFCAVISYWGVEEWVLNGAIPKTGILAQIVLCLFHLQMPASLSASILFRIKLIWGVTYIKMIFFWSIWSIVSLTWLQFPIKQMFTCCLTLFHIVQSVFISAGEWLTLLSCPWGLYTLLKLLIILASPFIYVTVQAFFFEIISWRDKSYFC